MTVSALQYLGIPYIAVPAVGAAVAAWLVSDWRQAAAVVAGALAYALVFQAFLPAPLKYLLPVVAGAGIGCLCLSPFLRLRPKASRWTRVAVATLATAGAGAWLVSSNPGIV